MEGVLGQNSLKILTSILEVDWNFRIHGRNEIDRMTIIY